MIALALFAVAVIGLAWWWRYGGKRQRSRAARTRERENASPNFHCVEVRYQRDACDAVKRIGAKRFLPGEAPEIPLPGCTAAKCSCRYVHHEDRRTGDRRNPFPMQASAPSTATGGNRRTKRDRRRPAKTPGSKSGR